MFDSTAKGLLFPGFVVASVMIPDALAAQDIEMAARVSGRTLPATYRQRIDRRPDFFEIRHGWTQRTRLARTTGTALAGELPIIVVPALFADSPVPSSTPADVQAVLFDGPSATGTLSEYYDEVSGGRLQITGEVADWVQTSLTVAEVRAGSFGLGSDARTGEFLAEAVALADAAVDFSRFDNDGPDGVPNSADDDGIVDAIAIEFLEAAVTCAGQGPTIWAHRSRLSNWNDEPYVTDDLRPNGVPVIIDDYFLQAAVTCTGLPQRITTFAHELGHILGLPDLYDRTEGILAEQRNWVVGCWSLMAAGTWGCGPALANGQWDRPTHLGPWEKSVLGWLPNLVVAESVLDREYTLRPVEQTGDVLQVPLTPTEYLLVEYRDRSGFDQNLPAPGILVFRVDLNRPTRRCRSCRQRYLVGLIEADANGSLLRVEGDGGSRGEAGDIFATDGPVALTANTHPALRLNAGGPAPVAFHRLGVADGVATVRLSTATIDADRLLEPFTANGATPLMPGEREYLDGVGNQNGRYDVGDLRRYLLSHPTTVASLDRGNP